MLGIIRLLIFFPFAAICFAYGILVSCLRPFHPNNVYATARLFKYSRYILGLKYEIQGEENLDSVDSAVLISNHQNNYDMIMAAQVLRPKTVSLGKASVVYIPIFGQFYWLAGNVLVNRGNHKKAMKSMAKVRKKIEEKKLKMWILPEGHRSRGKGLLPFKKGAFYTAILSKVPIVPIIFCDYNNKIDLNKKVSAVIKVRILEPISTSSMTEADVPKLLDHCYQLLDKNIKDMG